MSNLKIIKELRKKEGLSAKALGDKLGLSQQYVSDIENERTVPSAAILKKLADYFNISVDYLLGKTESPQDEIVKMEDYPEELGDFVKAMEFTISNSIEGGDKKEHIREILKSVSAFDLFIKTSDKLINNVSDISKDRMKEIRNLSLYDALLNISNSDKAENYKRIFVPILTTIESNKSIISSKNIESYYPTEKEFISEKHEYFWFHMPDDSLDREFNKGNLVLIQMQDHLENGEAGLVLIENCNVVINRISMNDGIITLTPNSNNPEHYAKSYDLSKVKIDIIGKVVCAIKTVERSG